MFIFQLIVFNLKCTPLELIDKILEFKVLLKVGLKMLYQPDAGVVGTYNMDLGMVYRETSHLFRAKWLTLLGTKHHGEVKVCVV